MKMNTTNIPMKKNSYFKLLEELKNKDIKSKKDYKKDKSKLKFLLPMKTEKVYLTF